MESPDRDATWIRILVPVLGLSACLLAPAVWTDPYRHGLSESFLIALCYVALTTMVHAGTLAAMDWRRWAGWLMASASGALFAWAVREETYFPASTFGFAIVAGGQGVVYAGLVSWLVRRVDGRRAAIVALGAAPAFVVLVMAAFHSSATARWQLLRQNPVIGMPAYYALARPMEEIFDALWSGAQSLPEPAKLTAESAGEGRNLVFILVDTWRADSLTAYRDDTGVMPRLDALSRECVVFDDVQANSSWTRSSVASFFTGLRPEEHGAIDRGYRLLDQNTTLAEIFQNRGYETAAFITNYANVGRDAGFDQGFSSFEELNSAHAEYARADEVNVAVLDYVDSRSDRESPLFLYIHYLDPHTPFLSGVEEDYGSASGKFSLPARGYRAELRFTDRHVPRLIEKLRSRLDPSTIYFVTSDHGEELGDHGSYGHGHTLHPELTHLPALLCGRDFASRRVHGKLEARDFYTLLPRLAAGHAAPLEAWVQERARARAGRRYSSTYVSTDAGSHRPSQAQTLLRAIESDGWKLIWSGYGDTYELYEPSTDPRELDNRARHEPARVARFAQEIEAEIDHWSVTEPDSESDRTLEQLRKLGYVE